MAEQADGRFYVEAHSVDKLVVKLRDDTRMKLRFLDTQTQTSRKFCLKLMHKLNSFCILIDFV